MVVSGDTLPTAVSLLHNVFTYDVSTVYNTYQDLCPAGGAPFVLLRDPLRSLIYLAKNPNNLAMSYTAIFYQGPPSDMTLHDNLPVSIAPLYFVPTNSSSYPFLPHGNTLYVGQMSNNKDLRFVWMDRYTQLTLTVGNANTSDMVEVYLAMQNSGAVNDIVGISSSTGTYTYQCGTNCGYYALQFRPTSAVSNRVIFSYTLSSYTGTGTATFGDSFAHIASPGIANHLTSLKKVRIDAASILVSPVANKFVENGVIHATYVTDTVDWINNIQTVDVNNMAGGEDFLWSRRRTENGMYSFLKPAGMDDLKWRTETAVDNTGTLSDCFYPLDINCGIVCGIVTTEPTQSSSVSAMGAILEITVFHSLEWIPTNDQWFETHLSTYGNVELLEAFDHLRAIPTFYDNPIHMDAIKRGLARTYRFVRGNRNHFAALIGAVFPTLKPVAAAGAALLGALPE